MNERDEDKLLEAVALQNAATVFIARQRAEQELLRTREQLEARTAELMRTIAALHQMLLERDQAQRDAEEARRLAQGANDAKSRFLRMISHELRTPLGAIGGYASLMADGIHGPLNEQQTAALTRIKFNQKHLLRLVDELLDFARIDSGNFTLRLGVVALAPLFENVRLLIEPVASVRGQTIELSPVTHDLCAYADADRVEQILINLVANASKFSSDGDVIRVSARETRACVEIQVTDHGLGIPMDKQEQIFESFYQVMPSLSTIGGTGLGLAISRQLAQLMHGSLTVESVEGRGSTFTLSLPRADAVHAA